MARIECIELLEQALSNITELSDSEIELLGLAKVEIGKNRRFFQRAKAILREVRFETLLAGAKGDELEGHAAKKNQTARLIWRIKSAIKAFLFSQQGLDNGRK